MGWKSDENREASVLEESNEAEPGTIVKVEKDAFIVQTGKGQLKVLALQISGKREWMQEHFLEDIR